MGGESLALPVATAIPSCPAQAESSAEASKPAPLLSAGHARGDGAELGAAPLGHKRIETTRLHHFPLQDTRAVLGLSLAAALNRPLGDSRFGVFRM